MGTEPKYASADEPELEQIARRLRMARASLGITQMQAAERAGISQSLLSLYEHGKRDMLYSALKSLAIEYHVSADWLVGLDDRTPLTLSCAGFGTEPRK